MVVELVSDQSMAGREVVLVGKTLMDGGTQVSKYTRHRKLILVSSRDVNEQWQARPGLLLFMSRLKHKQIGQEQPTPPWTYPLWLEGMTSGPASTTYLRGGHD